MGLHLQVTLEADSLKPEDRVVNTWNVGITGAPDITPAKALAVCDAVQAFYRSIPSGQPKAVCEYFSPWLSTAAGGIVVKAYDNTDKLGPPAHQPEDPPEAKDRMPSLGSPIAVRAEALPATGATPLPSHLAAVLTLEGAAWDDQPVELAGPPVTRPQSRRRGRVYLGPLSDDARDVTSLTDASVKEAFRSTVFAAYADMRDAIAAVDATWDLAVWSRSSGALFTMESISMDDRLDVVQSRKRAAGTRTRVSV